MFGKDPYPIGDIDMLERDLDADHSRILAHDEAYEQACLDGNIARVESERDSEREGAQGVCPKCHRYSFMFDAHFGRRRCLWRDCNHIENPPAGTGVKR